MPAGPRPAPLAAARAATPRQVALRATPVQSSVATTASATVYPLTIENCGRSITFDQAPPRVITYYQTTLETLLALDLGDRIIGRAKFEEAPALPDQVAASKAIKQLSGPRPLRRRRRSSSDSPPTSCSRACRRPSTRCRQGSGDTEGDRGEGHDVYVMSAQCTPETVGTLAGPRHRHHHPRQDLRRQRPRGAAGQGLSGPARRSKARSAQDPGLGRLVRQRRRAADVYGKALGSDLIARAGGRNPFSPAADTSFPEVSVEEIAVAKPMSGSPTTTSPGQRRRRSPPSS